MHACVEVVEEVISLFLIIRLPARTGNRVRWKIGRRRKRPIVLETRRCQLRRSSRRPVDNTRRRCQARSTVSVWFRKDRGEGIGILWRSRRLALSDHLRHSILMAHVVVNLAAGVWVDFCDERLDSPLLCKQLLIMAILLLGLVSILACRSGCE